MSFRKEPEVVKFRNDKIFLRVISNSFMKYFRLVLVHLALLSFVTFLSFASLYIYKNNPEMHKYMESMKNFNFHEMVRSSIVVFFYLILIIYSFYFVAFVFLFRRPFSFRSVLWVTGIIAGLIGIKSLENFVSTGSFSLSQMPAKIPFIIFMGGLGLGARAIIEFFNSKEKQKELEKKNLQSELNLLRTQINPHFLFNTLNNIDALIRKDPAKASELLIKLSQEMRYMLYDSNTDKISLVSELEFIKDYLSLQKMRFKNPDFIKLDLSGDFRNVMLPPMLFIPFIENAFKHCQYQEQGEAISISLLANNGTLNFDISNCFDPDFPSSDHKAGGIGLELVKRRLELLYSGKHTLNIHKSNRTFHVSLTIQLDGN